MVEQGNIYWADLDPVQGREQRGRRPVLILSRNEINRLPLTLMVMVGTGADRVPATFASDLLVTSEESGLPKATVFLGLQIRSLDPSRLGDLVGRLPLARMPEVWQRVRYVMGDDRRL